MGHTRICIRWTIGDVSMHGFESLALSTWGAWRMFGTSAEYHVCVNTISIDEARTRAGVTPDRVNWIGVTRDNVPDFLLKHLDHDLAEGVAWKFAPVRLAPDSFELSLDNDLVMWHRPPTLDGWLAQDHEAGKLRCLLASDVRRAYGRFDSYCGAEALNSGLRGLPPRLDFEDSLRRVLQWLAVSSGFQTLTSELDEQGLQVAAALLHSTPYVVGTHEVSVCSPFFPHAANLGSHGVHFVGLNAKHIPWEYYGRPADEWMEAHWARHTSTCRERVGAPVAAFRRSGSSTPVRPRRRALVLVLDSVGIGAAPDADRYGDERAHTLGHIFEQRPDLKLPSLMKLGLSELLSEGDRTTEGSYGRMRPQSAGKDSTTGHWEIAGALLDEPFATFDRFPDELVRAIEQDAQASFIGNKAASGTGIIEELGEAHLRTGDLILYTSADSVLQIAAHEGRVPIERLYEICRVARRHADRYRIGRVIARPFAGNPGSLRRTERRHDFSIPPPPTVLDAIMKAGLPTIGVGKTGDLFNQQGLAESHATSSNHQGMQLTGELWTQMQEGLLFTNLVDFDTLFGHRRDVDGYARALEEFDLWLGQFVHQVRHDDLVIITADHGNDPTFRGTDHTREEVPLLVMHRRERLDLGTRATFADVAATLCEFFRLERWAVGTSFLPQGSPGLRALADADFTNASTAGRDA